MSNKQLSAHNYDDVIRKAKDGLALNLRELAIATGYSYWQWREWKHRGLPLVARKMPVKKALAWVDQLSAGDRAEAALIPHRSSAAGRFSGQL